ncbi:unnamed protein product [Cylicocyclus nassatus]|uniref:MD-2-related lipid-recognition domain-containing protein n=1 Tax=Cylicocyclus nassatus TaxID=53992 RepID=A0AA36GVJ5_CYLNA|nr:unnamed protein product [Cylicocyclus nassatus]
MERVIILLALSATSLACKTWPNGTDKAFHWYQCNSGPVQFLNATPFDETGQHYQYPVHLGKPMMVKCALYNPTHNYTSPNLKLSLNLWSWGTAFGGCDWSVLPTFGLLNNLDACSQGVPCPILTGHQELDVTVDFSPYQAIIDILKDDTPYQMKYFMHDLITGDDLCLMAQCRLLLH